MFGECVLGGILSNPFTKPIVPFQRECDGLGVVISLVVKGLNSFASSYVGRSSSSISIRNNDHVLEMLS
jgi:hypothetical protein